MGIVPLAGFINVPEDQLLKRIESILSHQLSELPVMPTGEIPAQIEPSLSYGFLIPILVVNALTDTSHSVSVRLYRPGYDLVEVQSWEKPPQLAWKAVPDVEGQEKTLDKLITWPLEPGSATPAHRKALFFGAQEYARLAAIAPSADMKARLVEKASHLREQAEK
jgi:hypothetical protein